MKTIVLFILLLSSQCYSQSIDLGKFDFISKTYIDKDNKELYVFYGDSLSVIDLTELKKIRKIKLINTSDIVEGSYTIVSIKGVLYFIEIMGGGVYKLLDNQIIRLDNSFTHKMTINSSIFIHNDTMFRYGGYGYWSMRNFFTYFDFSTSEWEIISPSGSKTLPEGSINSTVKIYEDEFYIWGGETLNPFKPMEFNVFEGVWKFNIEKQSWSKLGDTKFDLSKMDLSISYNEKQIYSHINSDHILMVDIINNSCIVFNKTSFQQKFYPYFKSEYIDGVFYCFLLVKSNDHILLSTRSEDEFFGQFIKEERLYTTHQNIYIILSIIGFIIIFVILVISYLHLKKWRINKNKIIVTQKQLIYQNQILSLNEKSIKLLNLFFKSNNEVLSRNIMEIVENRELNYGHNTRIKNQKIDQINMKLKFILKIDDDLITFRKSDLDKRIKVYSLNMDYFHFKRT